MDKSDWLYRLRDDLKPNPINSEGMVQAGSVASEESSVLLCGFIACELRPFNPPIDAFPRLLPSGVQGFGRVAVHHDRAAHVLLAQCPEPCESGGSESR